MSHSGLERDSQGGGSLLGAVAGGNQAENLAFSRGQFSLAGLRLGGDRNRLRANQSFSFPRNRQEQVESSLQVPLGATMVTFGCAPVDAVFGLQRNEC